MVHENLQKTQDDRSASDHGAHLSRMCIGHMLGLRPLDRVVLADHRAIAELNIDRSAGLSAELPYLYFQRVLANGQLELRGAGGCAVNVDAADICDVLRGEPVRVMAMTRDAFKSRIALPLSDRQRAPDPDCFAPASVLYASKDRWGRVELFVWFDDHALNDDRPWRAILPDSDRRDVVAQVRRTKMPVMARSASAYSADHGTDSAKRLHTAIVREFIGATLRGDCHVASELQDAGLRPVSQARLSRMMRSA